MSLSSRLCLASILALLAAAGAATAQVMVLAARGPIAKTVTMGMVLKPGRTLDLKAGDSLDVLDHAAQRTLSGPAVVTIGKAEDGTTKKLIDVFIRGEHARPGIAATRGGLPAASLWQADFTQDGNICALEGQRPSFTRKGGDGATPRRLRRVSTGETQDIVWPEGAGSAPWPASLPIADAEGYVIELADGASTFLVWRIVTQRQDSLESLSTELYAKGCFAQLSWLSQATALRGSSPGEGE